MKICAVIPAHNEAATIGDIVQKTKQYVDRVFVVENLCTDDTPKLAWLAGADVISCSKRGYGAAQYEGQNVAMVMGYEYILQLDADGQHHPDDIPTFIRCLTVDDYDILLGSRFLMKGYHELSNIRQWGIVFFSKLVSFVFRVEITDITSGFKVYKVSSLKRLHKPSDTNPAIEQMAEIAKKGMKIGEIPILCYKRKSGDSHLSFGRFAAYPLKACWQVVKVLLLR